MIAGKYVITPLDRRHRGHGTFSHYIEGPYASWILKDKLEWKAMLGWCSQTFGASISLEEYEELADALGVSNNGWCWGNQKGRPNRIYVNEACLSHFVMRWT